MESIGRHTHWYKKKSKNKKHRSSDSTVHFPLVEVSIINDKLKFEVSMFKAVCNIAKDLAKFVENFKM